MNLFKEDGTVIHFAAPKVQASIAANTYVVSGNAETKKLQDLLPVREKRCGNARERINSTQTRLL